MSHVDLEPDDVALLKRITGNLGILADLCRADLLLYCRLGIDRAVVVAQGRPHSFLSLFDDDRVGKVASAADQGEIIRALQGHARPQATYTIGIRGATIARQVLPVRNADGRVIAVLTKDAYWLAHERHRRRSHVFQDALVEFTAMVLHGDLSGVDELTSFGEHDGIVFVGADRRVLYMSGIAAEQYRHLGYRDSLVGRRLSEVETVDNQLVAQVLNEQICVEETVEQDGWTWIRKVLPVTSPEGGVTETLDRWQRRHRLGAGRLRGAFVLVHDVTEALRTQRELESKMALVREVHHRVKNNLQVIASLLRMQARRTQLPEARAVLEESVNRILSVAVVHEFLSQNARGTINLREVAHRIMGQMQQGLIDPEKQVVLRVEGPDIWLPAERATQCALVINELVQNAIEHGLVDRQSGHIDVELVDHGDQVSIMVRDDGAGLPEGFDLDLNANLGLRIVKSMVERDLRGEFELKDGQVGTIATVRFEKSALGGG